MPPAPSKTLEVVPNPHPDRDYEVSMTVPEFTCLCPRIAGRTQRRTSLTSRPLDLRVSLGPEHVRLDSARVRVDDPIERHPVARVKLALPLAIDGCRPRRQDLDGERRRALDPAARHG